MIRYLIHRPIAVLLSFFSLILAGLFLAGRVPVSLLPEMEVPKIIVKVHYPGNSAGFIEQRAGSIIREGLVSVKGLSNLESCSSDGYAVIELSFEFGTKMAEAYMEVNEKIDRLLPNLPSGMPRPDVIRVNPTDIPVVRIQVTPVREADFKEVSDLSEKVIKGRLARLPGVATVDINGSISGFVAVEVHEQALNALKLQRKDIEQAIKDAVPAIGELRVTEGQYSYFVRLGQPSTGSEDISRLPVKVGNGGVIRLEDVATIKTELATDEGYHLYNGNRSVVLTVQKQPDAKMNELIRSIKGLMEDCTKEYPKARFALSRDQSYLIEAGISNLYQDVIIGGMFTIAILFLFLGNFIPPFLMAINIPISLAITFIFFHLFDISFNIISLSGLALGVGMLIDNSIVVIDSISRKRSAAINIMDAAVEGTNTVVVPVTSQVLTTVAVYAPLILMDGMASKLIFDQSLALTISLGVSLAVAFILTPLLYRLLSVVEKKQRKNDTFVFSWIAQGYHRMIDRVLKKKRLYMIVTMAFMPIGFILVRFIPVRTLPRIEETKGLATFDWNGPVGVNENLKRIKTILQLIKQQTMLTESDIGISKYGSQPENGNVQYASIYFECRSENEKMAVNEMIAQWMKANHPKSFFATEDAPNGFTQVFASSVPYFEVRIRSGDHNIGEGNVAGFVRRLKALGFIPGKGLLEEKKLVAALDYEKMAVYGVDVETVEHALSTLYGHYAIPGTTAGPMAEAIHLTGDQKVLSSTVRGNSGTIYPIREFFNFRYEVDSKFITADRNGRYVSLQYDRVTDAASMKHKLESLASRSKIQIDFNGQFVESSSRIWSMVKIFCIVLFLLYIILAYEYEDLLQPLIVMMTIPLGVSGALLLLYVSGASLDVMALIGLIVVLGLIVDDPILKVETLNSLRSKYMAQGARFDEQLLKKIIYEAGDICLKPLLMVSLTTSVALIPVFFVRGIGNDLQKPLALVIIGGLTIGTFFTTWFVPLSYWYLIKIRKFKK
ncbi:efflux RND transporter permease subunit [Niastella populi]|uniref:Acriflavin resistance protein n=1 Tax=Niastella populi TaxID=550983 RepID=A0A1V9FNE5_9BACT|nr:efflux RND transporter permease subunit [Niastella populi]OQP59827.1 hypothetical protein A4R26_20800 [Niastella populi]